MAKEMVQCPVCGEGFKTSQGLAGHMQSKHKESSGTTGLDDTVGELKEGKGLALSSVKSQSALERLVNELTLPELVDGQSEVFDSGVRFGIKSVLVGVQVAQVLSAMGVQQAVPIIKMAQEMRQSENQAAHVVAGELAQAVMNANREVINALGSLKPQSASADADPITRLVSTAQSIPQLFAAAQQLMEFFGGMGMPSAQPARQGVPQGKQQWVGPVEEATDEEIAEAFGD